MEATLEEILSSNSLKVTENILHKFMPAPDNALVTGLILAQTIDSKNWNALLRCLLRIAQCEDISIIERQSALIRFFQQASNIPLDYQPVLQTAELLKSASQEASRFVQFESKLSGVLIRRLDAAIGDLHAKFRSSDLIFTLARIAKEHSERISETILLSELTDEDLEIIENYKQADVKEVLKRLIKSCEIADSNSEHNESLKCVIFNTLLFILRKRMYDKSELMDQLEANLKKYAHLFTDRQLEQLLERYSRLCGEFNKPQDTSLLQLLSPPSKTRGVRFQRKH